MIDTIMEIKIVKYGTTLTYCGCPDYQYRQAKVNGSCKHMNYLNQKTKQTQELNESEKKLDKNDFRNGGMRIDKAFDKYGDVMIDKLIKEMEICEHKGKLVLLE